MHKIITNSFRTKSKRFSFKSILVLLSVLVMTNLQSQITYSFTTAGATGRFGPSQAQLNTAYASTNLNGAVTTTNGIQSWTVPVTGQYKVEVYGAQGGSNGTTKFGGKGAYMSGKFSFTAGQVLQILVGQEGTAGSDYFGGGGGSFVVDAANTPLIIAGGGGGAGGNGGGNGIDGVTGTAGTAGVSGGTGGINGNGGYCTNSNAGAGGGFYTDGNGTGIAGSHGLAFLNGGTGGQYNTWMPGGFGGGGNGWNSTGNGGGGGGYSGGGTSGNSYTGGGGGGSFNNGTDQINTAGVNNGQGKVSITLLEASALHFDGTNDFITATDPNFGTGDFTMEAWFKPTTGGYILTSRTFEAGPSGNWWSLGTTGSAVSMELAECGVVNGYSVIASPTTAVTPGVWNHMAFVRTGVTYKVYVNGVLQTTFTDSFVRNFNTGQNVLRFGGWPDWNGGWYGGALDEVRIWNVARTQCEINSYMNCEIPTTASGLMRNYHFNQGYPLSPNPTVTALYNSASGSNNGTLNNFALNGATSNWITPGAVSTGSNTPAVLNPTVTASVNNSVICAGQSVILTGGGASTYTWTGGVTNGVSFSPVSTATYTVSGTNTLTGCSSTNVATQGVTVNPLPVVTANATSPVICLGKTTTLNGGGASTYTWTGGVTNATPFSPANTATYTVVGTNATTGCTNTASQGVTVNPLPVITANSTSTAICIGQQVTLTGSGATTYTWTGGVTNGVAFAPASTATYIVTGTLAATGCTNTASKAVTVNPLPVVTANATSPVICNGQSTTLNGGGASTYTWTGGVSNGVSFSPANTATYTVVGTNATTGCTNTASQGVTVNPLPVISVNSGVICAGQSFTMVPSGASTYTYSGGNAVVSPLATSAFTVTGTSSAGCVSSPGAVSNVTVNAVPVIAVNSGAICNGQSFTITPSGANTYTITGGTFTVSPSTTSAYSVTGTSAQGCVSSVAAVSDVTVNALPVVTTSISNAVICEGSATTLNGAGADTYTWTGGVTDGVAFVPTASGSYTVTGTNTVTGCSNTAVENVTVNTLPVVTAAISNSVICEGSTTTLNGAGADTYTWTGGVTDGVAFTPTVSGSYTVTGTNTLTGCTSTNTAVESVTVNANPIVTAANGAVCIGGSYTITPSGAASYTYSGGSNIVTPSSTTSYTVTGESAEGCTGNTVITVSVQSSISVSVTAPAAVCEGQTANITATGASTYSWNTGATSSTITPTLTASATYTVFGVSGSCSDTKTVAINVNPNPTVNIVSSATTICAGESVTLTANGATSYTWNTAANGASISESPSLTVSYTVTGSDVNGCTATATIQQSVSACTGLEEQGIAHSIKIYPNPGTGLATIELYSNAQVLVINVLGDVISNSNLTAGNHQLDIREFANGIYFVKVIHNKNQETIKLIKQ